jgi:hypothetical protein
MRKPAGKQGYARFTHGLRLASLANLKRSRGQIAHDYFLCKLSLHMLTQGLRTVYALFTHVYARQLVSANHAQTMRKPCVNMRKLRMVYAWFAVSVTG